MRGVKLKPKKNCSEKLNESAIADETFNSMSSQRGAANNSESEDSRSDFSIEGSPYDRRLPSQPSSPVLSPLNLTVEQFLPLSSTTPSSSTPVEQRSFVGSVPKSKNVKLKGRVQERYMQSTNGSKGSKAERTSPNVYQWVEVTRNFTDDSLDAEPLTVEECERRRFGNSVMRTELVGSLRDRKLNLSSESQGPFEYDLNQVKKLNENVKFIDTHCHLDYLFKKINFKRSFAAFRRQNLSTFPACFEGCIAIFCQPEDFGDPSFWEPLINEDGVWAAFGCHPHNAGLFHLCNNMEEDLVNALKHKKVRALGEIGLDYSTRNSVKPYMQQEVFVRQLKIALKQDLPIVIHCRNAEDDTIAILKDIVPRNHKIHRHCFTGNWKEAQRWLDEFENLYLGLTPLVTYEDAKGVREVATRIPLNKLLLETDAPYFLPRNVSRRTHKQSHPGMAIHVAAQVAKLRGIKLEEVLQQTRENTRRLFNI